MWPSSFQYWKPVLNKSLFLPHHSWLTEALIISAFFINSHSNGIQTKITRVCRDSYSKTPVATKLPVLRSGRSQHSKKIHPRPSPKVNHSYSNLFPSDTRGWTGEFVIVGRSLVRIPGPAGDLAGGSGHRPWSTTHPHGNHRAGPWARPLGSLNFSPGCCTVTAKTVTSHNTWRRVSNQRQGF